MEDSLLKKTRAKMSAGDALTNNVAPGESVLPQSIDFYGRSNAAQEKAEKLYAEPVDYSAIQAFAKQRGEQGSAAMLNALAAQFAGEQFQPVQEQMLKRAAAAQDPIKMAGGMITPDGAFLKDPEAERDKLIKMYSDQASRYAQIAQTADTARERIAAQRAQQELMAQMRMIGLDLQRQGLQMRAENAALARGQATQAAADRKDKQLSEGTANLSKRADDYVNLVAGVRELNNMLGNYVPDGKSIPGVGYGSDLSFAGIDIGGLAAGTEGKSNRSLVKNVANELLRAASGQAVTLNEYERQTLSNMAAGKFSEKDFLNAYSNVILPKVNEAVANLGGGFSQEVKDRYAQQGGKIDFSRPFEAPKRRDAGGYSDAEKERRYQEWKKKNGG